MALITGLLPNLPAVSGSGISAAAAAAATTGNAGAEDVDWASVDQVATLVSKTTLAGLQALWRQHAAAMDEHGREFAEKLYESHSRVVRVSGRGVASARRPTDNVDASVDACCWSLGATA